MKKKKTLLPSRNLRVPRVCCRRQMFLYARHWTCAFRSLWSDKERPLCVLFLRFCRRAVRFPWRLLWWTKVSLFTKRKARKKKQPFKPQIVCRLAAEMISSHNYTCSMKQYIFSFISNSNSPRSSPQTFLKFLEIPDETFCLKLTFALHSIKKKRKTSLSCVDFSAAVRSNWGVEGCFFSVKVKRNLRPCRRWFQASPSLRQPI